MADWPSWWQQVLARCQQSPTRSIEVTVDEIRIGSGSHDQNLDKHWWWNLVMNPNALSHTGVLENGMECEAIPNTDPVQRVRVWLP
jgi:hypothetical protein